MSESYRGTAAFLEDSRFFFVSKQASLFNKMNQKLITLFLCVWSEELQNKSNCEIFLYKFDQNSTQINESWTKHETIRLVFSEF